eukprot:jgi/Tetstr1/425877/TSEL_016251.t1
MSNINRGSPEHPDDEPPHKRAKVQDLCLISAGEFPRRPSETVQALPARPIGMPQGGQVGSQVPIDRAEYLRLIEQALLHLGFDEVAHSLEAVSGVELMEPCAREFRAAVLAQQWDAAASLLLALPQLSRESRCQARFLLLQQKFLQLVCDKCHTAALCCLRQELAPLRVNTDALHTLASCLMHASAGAAHGMRKTGSGVLCELSAFIPVHVMPPERRLETLLEQTAAACFPSPSLLADRGTHSPHGSQDGGDLRPSARESY